MNRIYFGSMLYLISLAMYCIGYEYLSCRVVGLALVTIGSWLLYDGLDSIEKRLKELEKKNGEK